MNNSSRSSKYETYRIRRFNEIKRFRLQHIPRPKTSEKYSTNSYCNIHSDELYDDWFTLRKPNADIPKVIPNISPIKRKKNLKLQIELNFNRNDKSLLLQDIEDQGRFRFRTPYSNTNIVINSNYNPRFKTYIINCIFRAYSLGYTIEYDTFVDSLQNLNVPTIILGSTILERYLILKRRHNYTYGCISTIYKEEKNTYLYFITSCMIASKYLNDVHVCTSDIYEILSLRVCRYLSHKNINRIEWEILQELDYNIPYNKDIIYNQIEIYQSNWRAS